MVGSRKLQGSFEVLALEHQVVPLEPLPRQQLIPLAILPR